MALKSKLATRCAYYQARVERKACLFLVATLKSIDHLCIDRTIDAQESIFEFFVPHDMQELFLRVMRDFEDRGDVTSLREMPNRLCEGESGN